MDYTVTNMEVNIDTPFALRPTPYALRPTLENSTTC